MEKNKNKMSNHRLSTVLFCAGGAMSFFGFVFPGWAWVLMTPGDTEMVPLTLVTIVGILGLILVLVAAFRRFRRAAEITAPK